MPTVADLDAEIRKLEEQKKALITKERDALVAKANDAIAKLRELGFNYRLAELDAPQRSTGTRRSGIREKVLEIVKKGSASRAQVLEQLAAKGDKSAEQSVSNALAALKKNGSIDLQDGMYVAK